MRDDAALGHDEAAVGLVRDLHLRGKPIGGKATRHLRAAQHLVLEVVLRARAEDAVENALATLDDPGDVQELLAGLGFELAPQLVRATKERHVVGVLEVGESDDPRETMRRAVLVKEVEPLEPEDALAAAGKVVEGSASHPADSDDDDVVPLHRA